MGLGLIIGLGLKIRFQGTLFIFFIFFILVDNINI